MRPTCDLPARSYVATFEFSTFDKSKDSELQNGISHTTVEEQGERNPALKIDET